MLIYVLTYVRIYVEKSWEIKTFLLQWSDSGEKSPRSFFRWFWDFLKEDNFFVPVFFTQRSYIVFPNVTKIFSQCGSLEF